MGTQSTTHPPRPRHASSRAALILLLAIAPAPAQALAQTSALTVPLILPSAIVFDSAGNLYLAETANHLIRKVDTTGNITTIAGTGTQGFSGDTGPATSATLDSPQGLALDSANNLYIADTHNHRIRKLSLATGIITTIAGTGTPGFSGDNASAAAAQLNLPTALALDTAGNLYLADTANHRIRRIDATTGIITTIAGNGTQGFSGDNAAAAAANIDSPTGHRPRHRQQPLPRRHAQPPHPAHRWHHRHHQHHRRQRHPRLLRRRGSRNLRNSRSSSRPHHRRQRQPLSSRYRQPPHPPHRCHHQHHHHRRRQRHSSIRR